MKNQKHILKKMRVIATQDVYYTYSDWETKEIDGVAFIYVIKNLGIREIPKLMRKESLEHVK